MAARADAVDTLRYVIDLLEKEQAELKDIDRGHVDDEAMEFASRLSKAVGNDPADRC